MADVQENKNALWRRNDQIQRYKGSETNTESSEPRNQDNVKVKFEDSCVFLAACSSGDIQEVENLIAKGADINTANIDGLTALHQACIDDKLPMVRFLVERTADIDASDNEGWTPLHATASCGFLDIARYLIDKGANIAAVNNDGELAYDLAEGQAMEDLLQDEMDKQGVDADAARDEEENMMLRDANQWLSNGYDEEPHTKTGATALHCAAAKGYTKVMDVLIQANADIDAQDFDGWTPLHAAAHWCMDEACKVLVEHLCNMEITNNSGQTAMDIVDPDIEDILKELKDRQVTMRKEDRSKDILSRGGVPYKRRSSVTRMSVDQKQNVVRSNAEEEREIMRNNVVVEEDRKSSESSEAEETADDESGSTESSSDSETEKKNAINRQTTLNSNHGNRQVNGTSVVPATVIKERDNLTKPQTPTPKIEETKDIRAPPPKPGGPLSSGTTPIATPRIQDLAKADRQNEADKENERLTERTSNKNTALTDKKDASLRKDNLRKEREERDEKKQDDKAGASEKERPVTSKTPLSRVSSAPCKIANTEAKQVPGFVPKPPSSRTDPGNVPTTDGPASWRAGLRKTESTSAVPETQARSRTEFSKLLTRSVSSPWLSNPERYGDSLKGRLTSALSGESVDTKNRYDSQLKPRSTAAASSGMGAGRAIGSSGTTTGSATSLSSTVSRSTAPATTTNTGRSTSTTSSYTYTPFVPMTRRRQPDAETSDSRRDRHSVGGPVTTATGTATASTVSAGGSGRRSFAPPARDEEKEVERKARARRARETRRSTQGVTAEDLVLAEAELKAANDKGPSDHDRLSSDDRSDKENKPEAVTSLSSVRNRGASDAKPADDNSSHRKNIRDSALTSDSCNISSSYSHGLRASGSITTNSITSSTSRASTAPTSSVPTATTTTTVSSTTSSLTPYSSRPFRSKYLRNDDSAGTERKDDKSDDKSKEQHKDTEESPSQKSSAIRSRRKRESRRDTAGVNPDDIKAAKKKDETEIKEKAKEETSRYGSNRHSDISSSYDPSSARGYPRAGDRPSSYHAGSGYSRSQSSTSLPDRDIDYKRLYEEQKAENEKLRKDVKKLQQELSDTKVDLEKVRLRSEPSRNSETAAERKEKRTLERKISELEEELRQMENLKQDNQRLKEENGALIRVISKLSK